MRNDDFGFERACKFSRHDNWNYPPGADADPRAPWNEVEARAQCRHCGMESVISDLVEFHSDLDLWLCSECYENGLRICDHCSEVVPIDSLYSEARPNVYSEPKREYYLETKCESCIEVDNCVDADLLNAALIPASVAESTMDAKGQPLPVRIAAWCRANEPSDKAQQIAERLIATFADCAFDELTGYERKVFRAVTQGAWRK